LPQFPKTPLEIRVKPFNSMQNFKTAAPWMSVAALPQMLSVSGAIHAAETTPNRATVAVDAAQNLQTMDPRRLAGTEHEFFKARQSNTPAKVSIYLDRIGFLVL
jgi:hypothetical protein